MEKAKDMKKNNRENIDNYNIFAFGIKGTLFYWATSLFIILGIMNFWVGASFILFLLLFRLANFKAGVGALYTLCLLGICFLSLFFVLPQDYKKDIFVILGLAPIRTLFNLYHSFSITLPQGDLDKYVWLRQIFIDWEFALNLDGFLNSLKLENYRYEYWAILSSAFWGLLFAGFINFAYSRIFHNVLFQTIEGKGKRKNFFEKTFKKDVGSMEASFKSSTLIGIDENNKPLYIGDKAINTHMLAVGTTGSGKTTTICNFIESHIERGYPVIFVDGKGDKSLARQIEHFSNECGNKSYLFTMDEECDYSYNPFVAGDYSQKKDRIIGLFDDQNEYYKTIGEGWLQTVFHVLEVCKIHIDLHSFCNYTDPKMLRKTLADKLAEGVITNAQSDSLNAEINSQKAAQEQIDSIDAKIRLVAKSSQGRFFNTANNDFLKPFDLPSAMSEGAFVYFGLETQKGGEITRNLGKLIVNDVNASTGARRDKGENTPMLLVFDEFGVFAGSQVLSLIKQGRDAGACCLLGTQNFTDLNGANNNVQLGEQIRANCNNFICHALGSGKEDRETAAQIFGAVEGQTITAQIGGEDSTFAGTATDAYSYKYNPAELSALKPGTGEGIIRYLNENNEYTMTKFISRYSPIRQIFPPSKKLDMPIKGHVPDKIQHQNNEMQNSHDNLNKAIKESET